MNHDPEATADEFDELRGLIDRVFTPSAPVGNRELFAGRTQQIRDTVDAVYSIGQHVLIHGERGVGKSSLARVLRPIFRLS